MPSAAGHAPRAAPTDLTLFRNTALDAAAATDAASSTDEPSVSNDGNTIFYTGNWYAAVSTDAGNTFSYLDPYSDFPAPASGGDFCCDQQTIYEPTRDLTFWLLQYVADGFGNNTDRVAVAHGQDGVATNSWDYWDLTPQLVGFGSGSWFDFPNLAVGANYLYFASNVFDSNGEFIGSVVMRLSLTDFAAGGTAHFDALTSGGDFSPRLVSGADTTMYWADHYDPQTLVVYSWPESGSFTSGLVVHSAYPGANMGSGAMVCTSPDGANMCGFSDDRLLAGWVSNGVLGFMWNAGQGVGGLGTFLYPYIHAVRINAANMSLMDEPIIWNTQTAWAYPGLAVDGAGNLGVSAAFGGGSFYPSSGVFVRDDLSPNTWQALTVRQGTNGPGDDRWGDFLTVRPASGTGNTWVGTSFTQQGPCQGEGYPCAYVEPRFLWFGRERDNPFPPPSFTLSVSAAGSGSGTVTSSPAGISCAPTCSASFASGTVVTLTASAASGSSFNGWSGACTGTGTCVVTMSAAQSVTATFGATVCAPRPSIGVAVAPSGPGRLAVTITAGAGTLQTLQFGAASNGLIDIGTLTGQPGTFTFSVPAGTRQLTFYVRRAAPGPTTVPLVVTDGCGAWQTFVGGGAGAF